MNRGRGQERVRRGSRECRRRVKGGGRRDQVNCYLKTVGLGEKSISFKTKLKHCKIEGLVLLVACGQV